ncbi:MAG: hypothetical protein ACR2RF_22195 [Geminicoccaceae bacterium]
MPSALAMRDDNSAEELRRTARLEDSGRAACRLLAIAISLDDGAGSGPPSRR